MTTPSGQVADVAGVLIHQRERVREIADVLTRYGFGGLADRVLNAENAPDGRASHPLLARVIDPEIASMTTGERVRGAVSELGTTWIKLGQMLSVRPDVVGQDIADELTKLQADVPADPPPYAAELISRELGRPAPELFATFESAAMASGSVAQVHRGTLSDGSAVAIKILHDGVERQVRSDLELMRALAAFVESVDDELARYRPSVMIAEFEIMMRAAIDLTEELRSLQRFTENFADEPDIVIPGSYPQFSSRRMLTMEMMRGERLSREAIEGLGWAVDDLVDRTTQIYLEMIFRDGQYHTDPHPGNFLLRPGKEIVILDFGDIGYLTPKRRDQLETLLIALSTRDIDDLTASILEITNPPADIDLDRLSADLDRWTARYLEDDLADLDMTSMVTSGMQLMHAHALSLPSDLATLFRVLLLLQGLAEQVGARNNLGTLMQPYVDEMMKKRLDPRVLGERALKSARDWNALLGSLPGDLRELLAQIKKGQVDVDLQLHDPDGRIDHLVDGMLVSALVLVSGQLLSRQIRPLVGSVSFPGVVSAGMGVLIYRRLRGERDDHNAIITRVTRVMESFQPRK